MKGPYNKFGSLLDFDCPVCNQSEASRNLGQASPQNKLTRKEPR